MSARASRAALLLQIASRKAHRGGPGHSRAKRCNTAGRNVRRNPKGRSCFRAIPRCRSLVSLGYAARPAPCFARKQPPARLTPEALTGPNTSGIAPAPRQPQYDALTVGSPHASVLQSAVFQVAGGTWRSKPAAAVEIIDGRAAPLDTATLRVCWMCRRQPGRACAGRALRALRRRPAARRERVIEVLRAAPALLQRPILVVGRRAVIARPPERVYELLPEPTQDAPLS